MSDSMFKQLVWESHEFFPDSKHCRVAKVPIFNHAYQAQRDPWGPGFVVFLHPMLPITDSTKWWETKGHETLELAMKAGQADFEQRIDSVLNLTTIGRQFRWKMATKTSIWSGWYDGKYTEQTGRQLELGYIEVQERDVYAVRTED